MSDKVLLIFEGNWADEMDISSWEIVDKNEWDELKKQFKAKFKNKEISFYCGTNEEMVYDNANEMISNITVKNISEEEYKVITKVFGRSNMSSPFGVFDVMCDLVSNDEENDNDDEEYNY